MIELQGIVQAYGAHEALRGIDLKIAPGEVFGIIGRSGAGKSSLVRTINLLNRPRAGKVLVAGRELTALPQSQLRAARREIGLIFQHFNLLSSRTVAQNVALPLELAGVAPAAVRKRVDELLDLVGLAGMGDRYPAQISGGQKQRVGIARALANRPKVLLSDEATSALDPETTRSATCLITCIWCVISTMVRPNSRLICLSSPRMERVVSGSSAEVASSDSSTLGRLASARAMPTRCFWPPLICAG